MNCKLPDITITGQQLSDLFFNHEHPEWDAFHVSHNINNDDRFKVVLLSNEEFDKQAKAALLEDAATFARIISGCSYAVDPELLVEDFLARL